MKLKSQIHIVIFKKLYYSLKAYDFIHFFQKLKDK